MQQPLEKVVTSASSISGMHWSMQLNSPPVAFFPSGVLANSPACDWSLTEASDSCDTPFFAFGMHFAHFSFILAMGPSHGAIATAARWPSSLP